MAKDYTELIPEPPEDIVDYVKRKGYLNTGWLIFKCGYRKNEQTQKKEKCLNIICSECGAHFTADRVPVDIPKACHGWASPTAGSYAQGRIGQTVIKDSNKVKCPYCGVKSFCTHTSHIRGASLVAWPLVITRVGKVVIAASYRISKSTNIDGELNITVEKYEAYIFDTENKSKTRCTAVERIFYYERYTNTWEQRKRFNDCFGSTEFVYVEKNSLRGTVFENCKLREYIRSFTRDNRYAYPIAYMSLFFKKPQIENLLVHGCIDILYEVIERKGCCGNDVNLKEKSPRKMLGVSKTDFRYVTDLDLRGLRSFKFFRDMLPAEPPQRINHLAVSFGWRTEEFADDIKKYGIKLFNCAERAVTKNHYTDERSAWVDWKDYCTAAKALNYDLKDPNVLFPRNLKAAHDNAIKARKYAEDEALREKFIKAYEELAPLSWQNGDFLIRPAMSEHELIAEGKCLSHCVGGYGTAHCSGKPIFFIRKVDEPESPYFTLQLHLSTNRVEQNRGKRNCDPPQEVKDFAERWISEIVKPQQVKEKKPRRKKAAAA